MRDNEREDMSIEEMNEAENIASLSSDQEGACATPVDDARADIIASNASADSYKKMKKVCNSSIGGQAVIEGVMMRGASSMATCVREENGNMAVEAYRIKSVKEKNVVFRIPFVRGIFNFGSSMVSGVKTLMRSAEVYAGEEEASKAEKWMAKKLKVNDTGTCAIYRFVFLLAIAHYRCIQTTRH